MNTGIPSDAGTKIMRVELLARSGDTALAQREAAAATAAVAAAQENGLMTPAEAARSLMRIQNAIRTAAAAVARAAYDLLGLQITVDIFNP